MYQVRLLRLEKVVGSIEVEDIIPHGVDIV